MRQRLGCRWAEALMDTRTSDQIAEELAALRRVAVLAARGAPPEEVFEAVSAETGRLFGADLTVMARYDPDRALTYVACWSAAGTDWADDRHWSLDKRDVSNLVFQTGRPVRMDDFSQASGWTADIVRRHGIRSIVGAPVFVEGRLWGTMQVSSTKEEAFPPDTETRLAGFTELAGTAIANAQARMELRGYADEQAALRRVATLVASGAPPEKVFAAVAAEAGRLLGTGLTGVGRYDQDGTVMVVGAWRSSGAAVPFAVGTRTGLGGQNLATLVFRTRRPVRIDDYSRATGMTGDVGRDLGYRSAIGAPITVGGRLWGVMSAGATDEKVLPTDTETRLAGFAELSGTAIANAQARMELRGYADEQAALRRVATLVASGAPAEEVFAVVTAEIGRVFDADFTSMRRYEAGGAATVVGVWMRTGTTRPVEVGQRRRLGGRNVSTLVYQTGQPARIDDYRVASGESGVGGREWGLGSAVGVPVKVEGRPWGVVTLGSASPAALLSDAEARLAAFTELAGTAIANAEARAALAASRARIVAAADEARRRIEHDLHDGAQQRLITLALHLRELQATAPAGPDDMVKQLDDVVDGLEATLEELREIAHGIHPAVLAEGGLSPALKALARHSPVPVTLQVRVPDRLPGPVEIAAYYVVSEALTNTAKHARASTAEVEVSADADMLHASVRDDGRGGADLGRGSGLVGLKDRVETLGGRITLDSRPGAGTALEVHIPVQPDGHGANGDPTRS
jgi:signal transduction histidine kinase